MISAVAGYLLPYGTPDASSLQHVSRILMAEKWVLHIEYYRFPGTRITLAIHTIDSRPTASGHVSLYLLWGSLFTETG